MYKHTLSYKTPGEANSVARRLKKLMRIECRVSEDGEGLHDVSWQTNEALESLQRGILIRTGEPDGVQFNTFVGE